MINDADAQIVAYYQTEYRGYVEYYGLAENLHWLDKLHWTMRRSLLMTLACKHKSSVRKVVRKYTATRETAHGPRAVGARPRLPVLCDSA
jgi:hypothetical protein